jgi:hypothetical protein
MAKDLHTVTLIKGTVTAQEDRLLVGMKVAVANGVGGGAGQAVTVAVAFAGELPANYAVMVNPGQDATWFVSGKTNNGFNVTLTPRLAANTLAAGTFDVLVVA